MAKRHMLRCVACGSLRGDGAFGINKAGELVEVPTYELERAVQTIGGRGRCTWEFTSVSPQVAVALRDGLRAAVDNITAALIEAGVEERLDANPE